MIGLRRKNSPLIGWKEVLGVCYGWTWDVVLVAKFNDFSKSMLLVLDFSVNCPLRSVSQQGLFFLSSFKYTSAISRMRVWHEKFFQYSCSFPAQVIVKVFYESAESMQALLVQKIGDELLLLSGILRKIKIVPLKFSQLVFTKQF